MPLDSLDGHLDMLAKECRYAVANLPHPDFPNSEELAGAIGNILDSIMWVQTQTQYDANLALREAIQNLVTELDTETTETALLAALERVASLGREMVATLAPAVPVVASGSIAKLRVVENCIS
jgi:hypothetical protein